MATSPYGCCPNCLIFTDNFNRETGLGCQWDTRQGSWSIAQNRLEQSGSAGAIALAHRRSTGLGFVVIADTPDVPDGSKYRLIANYVDDNNYHFAEYEFTSTHLTMRLYKRINGDNGVPLEERTWPADFTGGEQAFDLILSHKIFLAGQKYSPYQIWRPNPTLLVDGYGAGLGNGEDEPIKYDNFSLSENGDIHEGCLKGGCRCDDIPLPMELTAECTFVGSLAGCNPTSGPISVSLLAVDENSPTFGDYDLEWYGHTVVSCPNCAQSVDPFDLYLRFHCTCVPGDNTKRFAIDAWGGPGGADDDTTCESSATCDSFSASFRLYDWHRGGACSGQSGDTSDLCVEVTT
jgi:hypothetical protein